MSAKGRTQTPRARKARFNASRSGAASSCTTPIAPSTRTSFTPGWPRHGSSPAASACEMAATWARRGSCSNRSSEALAAAQASGLAMKVGPCISAAVGSSDQKSSKTLRLATVAASGIVPPVSALDRQTMSGVTPAAWQANIVPVRPNPVNTSSAMSGRPCRRAASATRDNVAVSWKRIPPAPCTRGSTITAASPPEWAASVASSAAVEAAPRGRSANTWLSRPAPKWACRLSSGSHTLIAPSVSP